MWGKSLQNIECAHNKYSYIIVKRLEKRFNVSSEGSGAGASVESFLWGNTACAQTHHIKQMCHLVNLPTMSVVDPCHWLHPILWCLSCVLVKTSHLRSLGVSTLCSFLSRFQLYFSFSLLLFKTKVLTSVSRATLLILLSRTRISAPL